MRLEVDVKNFKEFYVIENPISWPPMDFANNSQYFKLVKC